jgi:hypothetical protein
MASLPSARPAGATVWNTKKGELELNFNSIANLYIWFQPAGLHVRALTKDIGIGVARSE